MIRHEKITKLTGAPNVGSYSGDNVTSLRSLRNCVQGYTLPTRGLTPGRAATADRAVAAAAMLRRPGAFLLRNVTTFRHKDCFGSRLEMDASTHAPADR